MRKAGPSALTADGSWAGAFADRRRARSNSAAGRHSIELIRQVFAESPPDQAQSGYAHWEARTLRAREPRGDFPETALLWAKIAAPFASRRSFSSSLGR